MPAGTPRAPENSVRAAGTVAVRAALLTMVILAAVTGKVLATDPPTLPGNSPATDHIGRPAAPDLPSGPPDPRSLFLDLPDPPEPSVSEAPIRTADDQDPVTIFSEERAEDAPSRRDAATRERNAAVRPVENIGVPARPTRGAVAAPDISRGAAGPGRTPPVHPVEPGSGNAKDLLADPDCRFSEVARRDLEAGIVDEYLVSALQAVCRKHSIYVNVFKTGHTFGAGLAEGPTIPAGYGNAGGYPNTHYFGRAADIWEVDGKPVEGNGADPDVASVGRILAGLPSRNKPDVVIGPATWNQALGYGPARAGFSPRIRSHSTTITFTSATGTATAPPRRSSTCQRATSTKPPPRRTVAESVQRPDEVMPDTPRAMRAHPTGGPRSSRRLSSPRRALPPGPAPEESREKRSGSGRDPRRSRA